MIPTKVFFTKGTGIGKDRLTSFELALRDAGIEKYNLVIVSSIIPPKCRTVSKNETLSNLNPGEIVFCALARNQTNEPHRLVAASVGSAISDDEESYGHISTYYSFGEDEDTAGMYAEDMAATMLATTLNIELDVNSNWPKRRNIYQAKGHKIYTDHTCQTAKGDKHGLWTTVVAAMVFIE